jgi:predicted RNA binding protein YcfA (HicA-like mRNA interferase family)
MISMLVAEHVLKVLLTFASPGAYHTYAEGVMRSREVIAALERAGWQRIRQRGSHVQLKHPRRPGLVTVAHPDPDIPIKTLRSIEKQSGLKLR